MTDKPFKTLAEQIEILRDRNLTFKDEVTATQYLAAHGYYEIINGYKTPFLDIDGENFKEGTTFEDIFALYYFDSKVRTAVMSSLEFVESFLKQKLAYLLAEKHGENYNQYISKSVFDAGNVLHRKIPEKQLFTDRDLLFSKFHQICYKKYDPFKHYKQKHQNTPPWILVKGMDFGTLRTGIFLLNRKDKKILLNRVFNPNVVSYLTDSQLNNLFSELILIINKYRNRAAHGGRMYNYFPDKGFTFNNLLHSSNGISKTSLSKSKKHSSSLFILLHAIRLLQPNFGHITLEIGLNTALKSYSSKWESQIAFVLSEMEFPSSYIYDDKN
ncbi:Abi family protein [Leuconostoc carnosum]|uniref:Abi family protein n=1 Tax=Leuconostoc carnosum TaxID=1252 RepID=UPI00123B802C|nr:Abi family protein [Leuconostoc carnosum]KAA8371135.1 Abi family protein [Leuconostoc carnosum]KAA8382776.1 Abi family protein [Leuconostoc carnosum]